MMKSVLYGVALFSLVWRIVRDETHLRELSERMKDVPQNRRGRPRRGDLATSGLGSG